MAWEEIAEEIDLMKWERILDVCEGDVETPTMGRKDGVLALTDKRLVWLLKGNVPSTTYQRAFEISLQDIKTVRRTGTLFKSWTVSDGKTEYRFRIRFGRDAMGNDLFRFIIRAAQIQDEKTLESYRKKALARAKEVKVFGISTGITINVSGKDTTGDRCPECASSDTEEMGNPLSKLLRRTPWATHRDFRCRKCGYEWKYWFD